MKKTLVTLAVIVIAQFSYAQFNTSSGNTTTMDNVGIGTTTPASKVAIAGGDLQIENGQGRFKGWYNYNTGSGRAMEIGISGSSGYIYNFDRTALTEGDLTIGGATHGGITVKANTGDVGIGTTAPLTGGSNASWLTVNGASTYGGGLISSVAGVIKGYTGYYDSNTNSIAVQAVSGVDVTLWPAGVIALTAKAGGNVGIGTTTPDTKLSVNGTIHTKEVKVDLIGWPDYVFNPKYKLPSLLEVKEYVDKNQHLPDMPSEAEVAKNGINLGEIVKVQTKKIEELTLYLIDQQKTNQSQQEQINQLKEQLTVLTKTLTKN